MKTPLYVALLLVLCFLGQSFADSSAVKEPLARPPHERDALAPAPGNATGAARGGELPEAKADQAQQAPAPGNVIAAARTVGIVGENVIKARRGWINLEPGAKPAYVGIQGGTAPITLLRSSEGSLLGYTGNTGNDFIQLLQGKEPPSVSLPPSHSKEALEFSLPPPPDIEDLSLNRENALPVGNASMQPFGLSNPEQIEQHEEAKAEPPPAPKKAAKKKKKKKSQAKPVPLKLKSYKSELTANE